MANIFLVSHTLLLFHSRKDSWNKSAKYEKLGKYWPFCSRNGAITNGYDYKKKECIAPTSEVFHFLQNLYLYSKTNVNLELKIELVFIQSFYIHSITWYLFNTSLFIQWLYIYSIILFLSSFHNFLTLYFHSVIL